MEQLFWKTVLAYHQDVKQSYNSKYIPIKEIEIYPQEFVHE